jgi:isoaspartyl peptidase/L-asparaginase-like protein (Ntn-hydrolase superfamily)
MRVITQEIMTKKNEIVSTSKGAQTVETIKNIQKMINQYTIQPNTFTIEKAKGERVFDYSGDESKSLMERVKAINFTIKKNGKELGIISFDITGKLITQYITKDSQTYTISQNWTTIQVTEGYVVSN